MMSKKFEVVTEWAEPMKQMDPFLEQKLRHRDAVSSVYDPRWRDKDLRLNATLPGSGIWRIWWLHSSPALCMPTRFEDWKNTLSILTLLLPLPPPHELCLHPNPCWWSGLSFLWNQHWLLFCGWLHLSTHPNQCYDSVFYHCPLRKKSCPAQRGRGISTGAHYCHTFHESGYTAHVHWLFFCHSEQGLQFPYPDHELCIPDSSITTRGCSLISMCAHLPLTPSHLGSSSQKSSAKLGTLDQLIGISPDLTLASPLSAVIGFPSPVHHLYIPTSRCPCSRYVVDLLTVLGSVRDTEGLRMSSVALTWCSL